jgi:DNA-binding response OmpR family regulator
MLREKPHVLYVEDRDDERVMMNILLTQSGLDVTTVGNAHDCLGMLTYRRFDLVLLDNMLPDASGLGLCMSIREFDEDVPVVFYSGRSTPVDKQAAMLAGATEYLVKPNEIDHLPERVWSLIRQRRSAGA